MEENFKERKTFREVIKTVSIKRTIRAIKNVEQGWGKSFKKQKKKKSWKLKYIGRSKNITEILEDKDEKSPRK